MAACSFVERLFRTFTVDFTFLMQWQNEVESGFNLGLISFYYLYFLYLISSECDGDQSFNSFKR